MTFHVKFLFVLLSLWVYPRIVHNLVGCNERQSCTGGIDNHCEFAQYLADPCWSNVYYECVFGKPTPSICASPLVVNPLATRNPHKSLCDWDYNVQPFDASNCRCEASCATPPACGTVVGTNCTGTVLIPHACDCQFFWMCDVSGEAHLRACGPGSFFQAASNNGGNCLTAPIGISERVACLSFTHLLDAAVRQSTILSRQGDT